MSLKKSIFGSDSEKKLYKHLSSTWGERFNIYHNLPFINVFDINTLNVTKEERDFLLKTSIDYVICSKDTDVQEMCIEFDGINEGYSKAAEYLSPLNNPLRAKKLKLKLRIADEHIFPYYVISFHEKNFVKDDIHLTILDGIIGQTIAKKGMIEKINQYIADSNDDVSAMSEEEKDEYYQDMLTWAEVEQEMTWDPIAKKAAEIQTILSKKGIVSKFGYQYLSHPKLPDIKDINDIDGIAKRAKAFDTIKWLGCEFYCETSKGRISEIAWVRNFEGRFASPITIVRNIAGLLAFNNAAVINGIQI